MIRLLCRIDSNRCSMYVEQGIVEDIADENVNGSPPVWLV
jgi:peroxiredoxin